MSRYRKVEVSTYSDEKFRNLSPLPPCGQGLWLYLMTGPHTIAIPGLFRAGRAGLAEELGWPVEAFDGAFQELLAQGMVKADFDHRVVWLPNAIKHNKPQSPNVVTSWAAGLELIPECGLKTAAIAGIGAFLDTLNSAYSQAFGAICKSSPECSGKALGMTKANQEQEQEQEQIKTLALTAKAVRADSPAFIALPLNDKSEYPIDERRIATWEELYPDVDVRQALRNYAGWADAHPTKRKTRRGILGSVNSWLAKEQDKSKGTGESNGAHKKNSVAAAKQERSRAAIQKAAQDF